LRHLFDVLELGDETTAKRIVSTERGPSATAPKQKKPATKNELGAKHRKELLANPDWSTGSMGVSINNQDKIEEEEEIYDAEDEEEEEPDSHDPLLGPPKESELVPTLRQLKEAEEEEDPETPLLSPVSPQKIPVINIKTRERNNTASSSSSMLSAAPSSFLRQRRELTAEKVESIIKKHQGRFLNDAKNGLLLTQTKFLDAIAKDVDDYLKKNQ